jgi:hypothetical protein
MQTTQWLLARYELHCTMALCTPMLKAVAETMSWRCRATLLLLPWQAVPTQLLALPSPRPLQKANEKLSARGWRIATHAVHTQQRRGSQAVTQPSLPHRIAAGCTNDSERLVRRWPGKSTQERHTNQRPSGRTRQQVSQSEIRRCPGPMPMPVPSLLLLPLVPTMMVVAATTTLDGKTTTTTTTTTTVERHGLR